MRDIRPDHGRQPTHDHAADAWIEGPATTRLASEQPTMATANTRNPDDHPRLLHYTLPGGWTVLVGRTDADNDRLSLHTAKPNDWWFHVRGMPGSHVLLRARPGGEPDRATLKRAAAIAAYHSKARSGGLVPVSCTRARYVTKPRGAKPGTVEIRKEVILKVRPEAPGAAAGDDSDLA